MWIECQSEISSRIIPVELNISVEVWISTWHHSVDNPLQHEIARSKQNNLIAAMPIEINKTAYRGQQREREKNSKWCIDNERIGE